MLVTKIKTHHDTSGSLVKATIIKYKDNKILTSLDIKIGSELFVSNKKLKHFGRKIKVMSFKKEDPSQTKYGLRVNVKFFDNERRGIIFVTDLDVEVK